MRSATKRGVSGKPTPLLAIRQRVLGQPGPLAYRVDTLVLNRKIDEAGRPVPKVLKLGSLHDICRVVDGSEQTFEFGDTRYNVTFTGYRGVVIRFE